MLPIDLANFKTRLIGCGAVMGVGQILSNVLSGPAASTLGGGGLLVLGGSALATIPILPIYLAIRNRPATQAHKQAPLDD